MIIIKKTEPFIVAREEKAELKGDIYIASNHQKIMHRKIKFGIT